MLKAFNQWWQEFSQYYQRQTVRGLEQENTRLDDYFMLMALADIYGLDNPLAYYHLELLPELMPKFHQWHQKMGMQHSPFDHFPCSGCC